MKKEKGNTAIIISVIISASLIFGALLMGKNSSFNDNQDLLERERTVKEEGTITKEGSFIIEQSEDYKGTKGERVILENGEVKIDASIFNDNSARFYNVEMPSGKTVYFFVVKDENGVLRAAANECQVCFSAKTGFIQEGNEMVCNNCGNRYPIEKIATEKGGCNPAPINPNLKVVNGNIVIEQEKLEEVSVFF